MTMSEFPTITLTPEQMALADEWADKITDYMADHPEAEHVYGDNPDERGNRREALRAEVAVCVFVKGKWIGPGRGADVLCGDGTEIEVRWRSEEWHDLPVRDKDPDCRVACLVKGSEGTYTIRGFIRISSARRPEWRNVPDDGYWVPESALKPWPHEVPV
jgi:hypothetical protein